MALLLDGLDLLSPGGLTESGAPLRLPISSIDEDPDQPRQEFDDESLTELAATIRERGVRQPVSVREHPAQLGRWMLNFGARRLRASKLAELSEIPAFVDNAADSYDQVIENEQRKGLTPLELALFVQRRLTAGDSQAEVARRMGKSRQYVMISTALIDPPDWLMSAYRDGRCRGLNELHELRRLHAAHPDRVETWAAENPSFTRDRVAMLRAALEREQIAPASTPAATPDPVPAPDSAPMPTPGQGRPAASSPSVPTRAAQTPSLLARIDDVVVRVVANEIPSESGHVYVQGPGVSARRTVEASRLTLIGFGDC